MKKYTAVIERCTDTHLYVGFVPGFPGAHSQAETLDASRQKVQTIPHKFHAPLDGSQKIDDLTIHAAHGLAPNVS